MITKLSLVIVLIFLALAEGAFGQPETFEYESKGKRDPFVPLIGPERSVITGLEDVTSIEDMNLEGICLGPQGEKVAIINGQMVKENDKVGAFMMKKIYKSFVTFILEGKEYNLSLPEEGGAKSGK